MTSLSRRSDHGLSCSASARPHNAGAAHPAASAVDGGGSRPHQSAERIPRLAGQPSAQPRRIEAGGEAASDRRFRPQGAADDRSTARLRPRLTQQVLNRYAHHCFLLRLLDSTTPKTCTTAEIPAAVRERQLHPSKPTNPPAQAIVSLCHKPTSVGTKLGLSHIFRSDCRGQAFLFP